MSSKRQKHAEQRKTAARSQSQSSGRTIFLLGKPVRENTLFPELFALLEAEGQEVHVHLPHASGVFFPPWARADDTLLHRGLFPGVLAALALQEQAGLRFYNRIAATRLVMNRLELHQRLADAELPIPDWQRVDNWDEILELRPGKDLVIKAANGFIGRGAGVVRLERRQRGLPPPCAESSFPGPYVAEELIAGDGRDRKLYVVGKECRGLLKKWPREEGRSSRPFSPDAELADLAVRAGQLLGLEIYGVDFVFGPDGPVIVDVNPFPSFKGIPDAAGLIAGYLRSRR